MPGKPPCVATFRQHFHVKEIMVIGATPNIIAPHQKFDGRVVGTGVKLCPPQCISDVLPSPIRATPYQYIVPKEYIQILILYETYSK